MAIVISNRMAGVLGAGGLAWMGLNHTPAGRALTAAVDDGVTSAYETASSWVQSRPSAAVVDPTPIAPAVASPATTVTVTVPVAAPSAPLAIAVSDPYTSWSSMRPAGLRDLPEFTAVMTPPAAGVVAVVPDPTLSFGDFLLIGGVALLSRFRGAPVPKATEAARHGIGYYLGMPFRALAAMARNLSPSPVSRSVPETFDVVLELMKLNSNVSAAELSGLLAEDQQGIADLKAVLNLKPGVDTQSVVPLDRIVEGIEAVLPKIDAIIAAPATREVLRYFKTNQETFKANLNALKTELLKMRNALDPAPVAATEPEPAAPTLTANQQAAQTFVIAMKLAGADLEKISVLGVLAMAIGDDDFLMAQKEQVEWGQLSDLLGVIKSDVQVLRKALATNFPQELVQELRMERGEFLTRLDALMSRLEELQGTAARMQGDVVVRDDDADPEDDYRNGLGRLDMDNPLSGRVAAEDPLAFLEEPGFVQSLYAAPAPVVNTTPTRDQVLADYHYVREVVATIEDITNGVDALFAFTATDIPAKKKEALAIMQRMAPHKALIEDVVTQAQLSDLFKRWGKSDKPDS